MELPSDSIASYRKEACESAWGVMEHVYKLILAMPKFVPSDGVNARVEE